MTKQNNNDLYDFDDKRKQVYWDSEKCMFYWIEWIYTGNNDLPRKHYIQLEIPNPNA